MFMDWKDQYSENEYTTQCNLEIQCNPYQATNSIFHKTRTNSFTICMEIQKNLNSKINLEKEKWNWRNQLAWLQTILQSCSHQDSMVLAQRQKYKSRNKIKGPEINPCTYGHLIFDKEGRIYNGKETIFISNGAGKTGKPLVKEWNSNTV